jgi:hypothetical protein
MSRYSFAVSVLAGGCWANEKLFIEIKKISMKKLLNFICADPY